MTTFRNMITKQTPATMQAVPCMEMVGFARKHVTNLWLAKPKVSLEGSLF